MKTDNYYSKLIKTDFVFDEFDIRTALMQYAIKCGVTNNANGNLDMDFYTDENSVGPTKLKIVITRTFEEEIK